MAWNIIPYTVEVRGQVRAQGSIASAVDVGDACDPAWMSMSMSISMGMGVHPAMEGL